MKDRRGALALNVVAGVVHPVAAGATTEPESERALEDLSSTGLVDLLGVPAEPIDSQGLVAIDLAGDPTVNIASATGHMFRLGLPESVKPAPLIVDSATTTFTSADGSHEIVIEELGLNSFRALIVMRDSSAPSEYRFDLGLPPGWSLAATSGGEVVVSSAVGAEVGRVALPWAYDADGEAVETYFELVGNSIVQTVRAERAKFPVVADPAFQGDCGTVTCTVRLDRAQTKNARDVAGLIGLAGGICGALSGGALALVCAAAVAPGAGALSIAANRYHSDGNCLGVRFNKYPAPFPFPPVAAWPTQVKYATYNCK